MRVRDSRLFFHVFILVYALWSCSSIAAQPRRTYNPERMSDEELTKEAEMEKLRAINRALRKPQPSETRVIGNLEKIDCKKGIVFAVKTDAESVVLASRDFDSLSLNAFVPMTGNSSLGCDADMSGLTAVVTYRERTVRDQVRGDLTAIEFVPAGFRLLSKEEMERSFAIDPSSRIIDSKEQEAIARSIRQALTLPQEGETRKLGYLDRIECSSKGRYYVLRMVAKTYRLFTDSPNTLPIRLFTRELEGMQFGCTMQPIDVPVIFIYRERTDQKLRSDGEIVSLDFVPRGFTLD